MKLLAVVAVLICHSLSLIDGKKCNCLCDRELELGIVLDSSSSISKDDFNTAKQFLQDYVKTFAIGPEKVRVSLITYGRYVHSEDAFNLTTYTNEADLVEGIKAVPHHATDYTNTGAGIAFMRDHQLSKTLTRPGIRRVGVVYTDGNSQEQEKTENQAKLARDDGIVMFAVGIGHRVDYSELERIAGDSSRADRVDNFDKLHTIEAWLAKETCDSE